MSSLAESARYSALLARVSELEETNQRLRAEVERWRDSNNRLRSEMEHQSLRANSCEAELAKVREECEGCAWAISPAMWQARIDQLNVELERLRYQLQMQSRDLAESNQRLAARAFFEDVRTLQLPDKEAQP